MSALLRTWRRALRDQFTLRVLLLSAVPLLLSLLLWGVLLWFGLQPLVDWLHQLFAEHAGFEASQRALSMVGLSVLQVVIVPLMAIALLVPLMAGSTLLFMGVVAMPAIERHVSRRHYPHLERLQGGSFFGSLAVNLGSSLLFALLWLCTLPLYAIPPLAWLAHACLWAWVTMRVMSYDALAAHASREERLAILARHRGALLTIGFVSGLLGAIPGIAWMGGAVLSVVLFPFLAVASLWLYTMIFLFAGLWFQYYCLQALETMRAGPCAAIVQPQAECD